MNIKSLDFALDINGDGVFSPWEYLEALKWIYQLPGRLVIEGLGNIPFVASALNIQASEATGYASLYGLTPTLISLLCWLVLICAILSLTSRDGRNGEAVSKKTLLLPPPPGMRMKRSHRHVHRHLHS
ncbi:MAG: hypothetical protein WC284_07525 [Candidimonas sp.]|jgi:hypothetical protein